MKIKSIRIVLVSALAVPIMAMGLSFVSPVAQPVFAADTPTEGLQDGANAAKGANTPKNLFKNEDDNNSVFKNIANTALFIIGAISVLMLIYGGIRYTISGGDAANIKAAKETIIYSIVGIVVAIMAYAIVNYVIDALT